MTRYAFFCLPFYSHLRLFEALAGEMRDRGDEVSLVMNEGGARFVADTTLAVHEIGPSRGGARDPQAIMRRAARPGGPAGILRTVADTAAMTDDLCAGAPRLLRRIGAQVIVGDQMEPAGGLVARHLGLPFASVAAALPINDDPGIPPPYLDWPFDASEKGLKRNTGGRMVARWLLTRQNRGIAAWARSFGLAPALSAQDCLSRDLQIAQTVPSFDFPRPANGVLATVGPIRARAANASLAPLPFVPPTRRPLVFASFGTLQGHRLSLFRTIASACRELGVDLAVAHCGGLTRQEAATIDAAFVTDFVRQDAILSRASVCVTHAGLNTALDCLKAGVPMLALPIAFDQRGVAARILHHGVGEALRPEKASLASIRDRLDRLLSDEGYRSRARPIRAEIAAAGGLARAADLLQETFGGSRRGIGEPANLTA